MLPQGNRCFQTEMFTCCPVALLICCLVVLFAPVDRRVSHHSWFSQLFLPLYYTCIGAHDERSMPMPDEYDREKNDSEESEKARNPQPGAEKQEEKIIDFIRVDRKQFPFGNLMWKLESSRCSFVRSNILMKICFLAEDRKDFCPMGFLPYDPEMLSKMTEHPIESVIRTIKEAVKIGIIEGISAEELYKIARERFYAGGNAETPALRKKREREETMIRARPEARGTPAEIAEAQILAPEEGRSGHISSSETEENKPKKRQARKPKPEEVVVEGYPELPCKKGEVYRITEDVLKKLQENYPAVPVEKEMNKARIWLELQPTRRKTYGGTPRFLYNWFERAADRYPAPEPRGQVISAEPADRTFVTGEGEREVL